MVVSDPVSSAKIGRLVSVSSAFAKALARPGYAVTRKTARLATWAESLRTVVASTWRPQLFLVSLRYGLSGLNQMYSMRYGTVPIVRARGFGRCRDSALCFDGLRCRF